MHAGAATASVLGKCMVKTGTNFRFRSKAKGTVPIGVRKILKPVEALVANLGVGWLCLKLASRKRCLFN